MSDLKTYNFKEAESFLNECCSLSELYLDVCEAMQDLSCATKYQDREGIAKIWHTLLTCADFLDAIQLED